MLVNIVTLTSTFNATTRFLKCFTLKALYITAQG